MRARGAKVTDIVILVVARRRVRRRRGGDRAAKAGNVPVVVAINKTTRPKRTRARQQELVAEGVIRGVRRRDAVRPGVREDGGRHRRLLDASCAGECSS